MTDLKIDVLPTHVPADGTLTVLVDECSPRTWGGPETLGWLLRQIECSPRTWG
ncbi:hypothetical protein [Actinoallomurus liliacearum]|uniref:hypothetical protein n=1 Tax=Actinoallomurus liliacearum TaxID=1080073 RepID=UPI003CD0AF8E